MVIVGVLDYIMRNAYTQAHHNPARCDHTHHRDPHLVVYVYMQMIAPTYHMSRRDRMCIRAYKNSRDRSRRT